MLSCRKTQVLQQLSRLDSWNTLPSSAQQQLFIQQLLLLPNLQEPQLPSRGAFLGPNTSSTSNLVLPNLLNLPSNVQQQQLSYAAAAVAGQQQHQQNNNNSNNSLSSSLLGQSSVNGGAGLNNMMQQLQHLQQQQQQSRLSSNAAALLHHQLQQQPPDHHKSQQQQQQQTEHLAKDPIQDLVEQMVCSAPTNNPRTDYGSQVQSSRMSFGNKLSLQQINAIYNRLFSAPQDQDNNCNGNNVSSQRPPLNISNDKSNLRMETLLRQEMVS